MATTNSAADRQQLVERYAADTKLYAEAVEHLRKVHADTESFIKALSIVGAAHRACEQSRIALDRKLKSATTENRT